MVFHAVLGQTLAFIDMGLGVMGHMVSMPQMKTSVAVGLAASCPTP
jgi:hypothetical protein